MPASSAKDMTMVHSPLRRTKHDIAPLTGVRGVAAFSVVIYHIIEMFFEGNGDFCRGDSSGICRLVEISIRSAFSRGYLSVDLFFILSGFVISFSYSRYFTSTFTAREYAEFFFKRIARLYPAYFVILVIFFAKNIVNISGTVKAVTAGTVAVNLLMMNGWGMGLPSLVGASWSLSTEIVAYLCFPLLVHIVLRGAAYRLFLSIGIAAIAVIAVCASGLGIMGPLDVVNDDSVYPIMRCVAEFSLGMASWRLWAKGGTLRLLGNDLSLSLILVLLLCATLNGIHDLVLVALFCLLVIALANNGRLARALFGNRPIRHLGDISYSLYLCHGLFLEIAFRAAKILSQSSGHNLYPAAVLVGIALSLLFAHFSYDYIEIPGRQLLTRLFLRRSRQPSGH